MEKNPRTLQELEERFMTAAAGRDYLARLRWGRGFVCPACDGTEAWATGRGLWMCTDCGHQASVMAGTIFAGTHTPLTLWFRAIWWVVSQKNGASALGLQRVLGLGSYRTAWTWLHKLRRAMVRPGSGLGGGRGGQNYRRRGRAGRGTSPPRQESPGGHCRRGAWPRHRPNPDAAGGRCVGRKPAGLRAAVRRVEPGAVVITDGLQSYRDLSKRGYHHDRRGALGSGESTDAVLPRIHRVAVLLKRWLLGTHQGGVSREHLDYYLDEFTFRFNHRTSRHRGKLFYRLLEQAVAVGPVPYAAMVKGIRGLKKKHHHNGYGCWSQGHT